MDALAIIGKGIMPFMGGMRKFLPWLHAKARQHVPPEFGGEFKFNDMTCGSASGAALFRFLGNRVHANDLSLRSFISARAVFGGFKGSNRALRVLLEEVRGSEILSPKSKVESVHLPRVAEFLHPGALRIFDALYYARERGWVISTSESDYFKYIALRWVILNRPAMYYLKLPTHDLDQLSIQNDKWAKVVAQIRNPESALRAVMRDVNTLIDALSGATATVTQGDCREIIKQTTFGHMSITNLNPPTAGNSVFMQSNRVLDTLLFNTPQDLTDDAMPGDLWRSIILDTGKLVPSGHFIFSFCGDGALSWNEGMEVWQQLGTIVDEWSFPWHDDVDKPAGLVMIRRS